MWDRMGMEMGVGWGWRQDVVRVMRESQVGRWLWREQQVRRGHSDDTGSRTG